jgi:chemotaxis protein methyltransferase CheR
MNDQECVQFLQRALPRLRLRWSGFRRVRGQVRKRIERRMRELGIPDIGTYERRLASDPDEWSALDRACRITISRFYRDRAVGDHLRDVLLPRLAARARDRAEDELRCWSIGCGSGEEPYTISLIWHLEVSRLFPELELGVLGTDADPTVLDRAEEAVYSPSSLRDLPETIRRFAFDPTEEGFRLRAAYQQDVTFRRLDVRRDVGEGPFDLVLCRNLVLTYFDEPLQREVLSRVVGTMVSGGALIIGIHERLPRASVGLVPELPELGVYRVEEKP